MALKIALIIIIGIVSQIYTLLFAMSMISNLARGKENWNQILITNIMKILFSHF